MSEVRNVNSSSNTPFTGGLGTIDAGSSACLSAAVAEIIEMIQKMQQNQARAACLNADVQSTMSKSGAQAAIKSAQDDQYIAYCEMGSSIASAASSGVALAHSVYSTIKSYNLEKSTSTEISSLKNTTAELNQNAQVGAAAEAGDVNAPRALNAKQLSELKDNIRNGKIGGITEDHLKNLKANDEAEVNSVKEEIVKRQEAARIECDKQQTALDRASKKWDLLAQTATAIGSAAGKGVSANYQADKGQQKAIETVANNAAQQSSTNYQALVDARAKMQEEILQLISSKENSVRALLQYQG